MAIALPDILDQRRIALALKARTKEDAMRELIELLSLTESVSQPTQFLAQVLKREAMSATLTANGVAFPHARTDLANEIALAVGRSPGGILWNPENERGHLIFLIAVPEKLVNDYLVVVGALARIAKSDAHRRALMAADTVPEFLTALQSAPSL